MNPIFPVIAITLDRERNLSYPLPAIWRWLDAVGYKDLADIPPEYWEPQTARDKCERLVNLLWAGLITDDPSLTIEQVGAMVYWKNLAYVDQKTTEAFAAAMPERKPEDKAREADEPADPTPAT